LHFAVLKNRREMIALLLELGVDPLAVDGSGHPVAIEATAPDTDRQVMARIKAMVDAEMVSADRGHRSPRGNAVELLALLALGDWETAAQLLDGNSAAIEASHGVLHLMAKRNDVAAVRWLLEHGADPNGRSPHWDAVVTPLHLAAWHGHLEVVRLLLDAGADPTIHDSKHDSDAIGWAEFFGQGAIVRLLKAHVPHK
jgi:ankyrin repeat protein